LTPPRPRPATLTLEFTDVEVEGRPGRSVGVVDDSIVFVGEAGAGDDSGYRRDGRTLVVTGRGGALLPGLHDHHLHLMSLAARARSVPCGPPDTVDRAGLGRALQAAALRQGPGEWVRGYGYDDTLTGPLDAGQLDELLGEGRRTPVRIQHRSGHQWVLNTAAVAALGPMGPQLSPDGVYSELDGVLRLRWPASEPPSLAAVGRRLAGFGVTGVTDASVGNGGEALSLVASEQARGHLPQRVLMLGGRMTGPTGPRLRVGAHKIVLSESSLPSLDELVGEIAGAGARGVAVHCVSRESLVLASVALAQAGGGPHRIEHASVAPPEVVDRLVSLPVTVVTQPGFVGEHGDRYRREVEARDQRWLYRLRAWIRAGVPVAGSTDAPFGDADPWLAMRAAVTRRTAGGAVLGCQERLCPEEALALFLAPLERPGGRPRRVEVGAPADLCLLEVPWGDARHHLDRRLVRATAAGGRLVWGG
jgi:predicted amidohydrolase YtcJ